MALYFPCSPDNKNNTINQATITYLMTNAIGNRANYVIYGPYQISGNYQYFWGNAWDGAPDGVVGSLNGQDYSTATYFNFYKDTTPTNFISFSVSYKTDNGRFYNFGTNYSNFMTSPMTCQSDIYNTGVSFYSNITFVDRDGRPLIKVPDQTTPDGDIFTITNCWTRGTWISDTQPQVSEIHYRNFRAKLTGGKFALYPISGIDNGKLKMGIKNDATFYEMQYSTDGRTWTDTDTFPFDFFYRRRINELGEFDYALTFSNSVIPTFEDETTAQGYIDDLVPITDATNWNEIAENYPTQIVTGEEEEETTMGEVFTRSFFSQQYICSVGAIQEISNAFFDTSSGGIIGKFEDIKKGLEMYGESVVDSIQNCTFYPFPLSTVFTNVSNQNYIYFGGYKFDLQNNTVDKIIFPNGYLDLGTFDIGYQWGHSYRSYSPYTRLFCYLPYIGWTELDIARYVGKTASVRYYIDTRTGGCLACIFANSVLVDYFNGQIGVQMPLKLTDYSAYANAQIQTLLGGSSGLQQSGQVIGQTGQQMAQAGATMGELALGGLALGGLAVGVQGTKTLYGLTQNNINNFNKTKGASTSMLNQYLPQYVMFMIETQETDITPYEYALMGRPTNASGLLMEFSGYLEVDTVDLKCPYATDEERAEIIAQLQKGVYITEQI